MRPDVLRWQAEVEAFVRHNRFDAVVETPLADPDEARTMTLAYRAAGYRVELLVLAEAHAVLQLSVLDRFLASGEGCGRFISWDNLDRCVKGLPQSLAVIEAEHLAHRITVVRRDLSVLYGNELTEDGTWRSTPGADRSHAAELARPWTAPETWQFRRQTNGVEEKAHPLVTSAERRLAVAGGQVGEGRALELGGGRRVRTGSAAGQGAPCSNCWMRRSDPSHTGPTRRDDINIPLLTPRP
ncbi:zeta toxin family protein [Streptomyces sp. NPDC056682]|uniref:zeta toxin family protein n=1 Tax=Streptomyces sp. NPDC056682 TaxID=3345909 RepID=UPI003684B12E